MWCGPHWWKDLFNMEKWLKWYIQQRHLTPRVTGWWKRILLGGDLICHQSTFCWFLHNYVKEGTRIEYKFGNCPLLCKKYFPPLFLWTTYAVWTRTLGIQIELVELVFFFGNFIRSHIELPLCLWWADEDDMKYGYAMFFLEYMWKVGCILRHLCTHILAYKSIECCGSFTWIHQCVVLA